MKLKDIKPNPNNPRVLRDEKFQKLKQSITEFPKMLSLRPMVIDENNVVLGGNMRLRALQELGFTDVEDAWVKRSSDLTEEEKKRFIIADNVAFGEWDWDTLANDWEVVDLEAWGLEIPNFDEEPEQLEASEDDYEVPDGGIETDIVIGDLFEIGEHRLLCGDSTDSDAVARLMNGESIKCVITDPPYGINWNGDYTRFSKNGVSESFTNYDDIKNDNKPFDPSYWTVFDEVIIWGGNIFSNKLETGTWLIWDKRSSDGTSFLADAEVAWQKGGYGVYIKSINQQSEKSKLRDINHPTKKPIELMTWCIDRLKNNKLILDPYLGSGSTMVAAHQLKRRCYGMELEPKYCAVIIDRMAKLDPSLKITRNGKEYIKQ